MGHKLRALVGMVVTTLWAASCAAPPRQPPPAHPLASPRDDIPGLLNFAEVSPTLYRGAQPTREGFARLKGMGVKTVIDLRGKSHRDDLEGIGLKYVHIPMRSGKVEQERLVEFLRVVRDPANEPVFVHGRLGADRTGCAVAVYRMAEQGWDLRDAEAELPRFHFNPVWRDIVDYLEALNVAQLRQEVRSAATTTTSPASRSSAGAD